MRLVIVGSDNAVGKDGVFYDNLDLSQCGLPANFWALQWEERGVNSGHIEHDSPLIDNTSITELPAWASACVAVWQAEIDRLAAEEAQQAQQAQQAKEGE
jgi:hypothetical protein